MGHGRRLPKERDDLGRVCECFASTRTIQNSVSGGLHLTQNSYAPALVARPITVDSRNPNRGRPLRLR